MASFGVKSSRRLITCHVDIHRVMLPVVKVYDCSVIWGYRGEARQNRAVANGHSLTNWPDSRHNINPSLAIDIVPYPIDWTSIDRFKELAWVIKGSAQALDVPLEWGGDWENWIVNGKKRKDYAHWQLPRGYE